MFSEGYKNPRQTILGPETLWLIHLPVIVLPYFGCGCKRTNAGVGQSMVAQLDDLVYLPKNVRGVIFIWTRAGYASAGS